LIGGDRALGERHRRYRGAAGLQRDRLSGSTVVLQAVVGQLRIDSISQGLTIGAGAGAKITGLIVGNIVASRNDRALAVAAKRIVLKYVADERHGAGIVKVCYAASVAGHGDRIEGVVVEERAASDR
jgi:hypothetical protein